MAITANKLLGKSEKGGALAVRPKTNLVPLKKQSSSISKIEKKDEDPMLVIKTKVIKIEDLLKGTLAAEKKAAEEKRKVEEQEERAENEEEIENPDKKGKKSRIKIPVPGKIKGWWNNIKKFFFTVLFGWLALRVMKWLPKLKGILKFLASFADFVLKWGGKILNGLVTFVDWGYKAYDWTRDKIEGVFGEKGVQAFDGISGVLNKTMNLIFGIGLAMIALGNEWGEQSGANERNRIKNKNRQERLKDTDYKKKFNERVNRNRKFKRDQFFNKWKKRLGIDQPKVQGPSTPPKTRGKFLGVDWGKRAGQLSDFAGEKARGIRRGLTSALETGGNWFNKRISEPVGNLLENVNPSKWLQKLADSDLVGSAGARRLLGLIDNPALKRALGFAPFVGDAIIFISDILRGVHWTRALMRTATALAIDAGFNALLTATVAAAPFSGGASLALTAALVGAYMAADMAGGWAIGKMKSDKSDYQPGDGVGQVLGDILANALGLPKKQGMPGEEGKPWENMFGSSSVPKVDPKKVMNKLTKKEEEAIARVDSETIKGDLFTITFDGKTYPRGMSGSGETFGGKGGSTYNKIVSTISVNDDDQAEVVVVNKKGANVNNNTTNESQIIAVNTGGGGSSDPYALNYRG